MITDNSNSAGGITGTWMSKATGEVAEIRSSFIDGDKLIVMCVDGRQIDGKEFSDNWCQVPPDTVADMRAAIAPLTPSTGYDTNPSRAAAPAKKSGSDTLSKIFKNALSVQVELKDLDLPLDAIKVAIDYLDIAPSAIAEYIGANIRVDAGDIERQLEEMLK